LTKQRLVSRWDNRCIAMLFEKLASYDKQFFSRSLGFTIRIGGARGLGEDHFVAAANHNHHRAQVGTILYVML
jgi:hypothetical protein